MGHRTPHRPPPEQETRIAHEVASWYARGLFPMADPDLGDIGLYDPDPRAIIPLSEREGLHLPRRLMRTVRSGRFLVTSDRSFERVVAECAAPRSPKPQSRSVSADTWIDATLEAIYGILHRAGLAHSVEVWLPPAGSSLPTAEAAIAAGLGFSPATWRLVGGLFGVQTGAAFCAESMFSRPTHGGTDASKVALVRLILALQHAEFSILDTQFVNPHLEQFGCCEITRDEFHARLGSAREREMAWPAESAWSRDITQRDPGASGEP